ncbi:MAG: Fe-S cluster assembly protein HesB [Acidimicrobiia bacterium]|nr:Fe-S cluster assembly protein HesB [Acidimicrobiia bacterium]
MKGTLAVTGDPEADRLLNTEPLALVLGMLLDQQVPMEWAFLGPSLLRDRLGGRLDAAEIAAMDTDEFLKAAKGPRAIHRFPSSMAKRVQEVCAALVEHYGGRAENLWNDGVSGDVLLKRLKALPGFGDEKSKIFVALLAKRVDVQPDGWREAAGPFGDDVPRSVADVFDDASLAKVREWKKAKKAAGKTKQD